MTASLPACTSQGRVESDAVGQVSALPDPSSAARSAIARAPIAAPPATPERVPQAPSAPVQGLPGLDPAGPAPDLVLTEPGGARRLFSIDGYLARELCLKRRTNGSSQNHCLTIAWPSGPRNSLGTPCGVAETIDPGWFRAISNTLLRVPLSQARTLHRIVIDNRPLKHGIAAYDRKDPNDARDGHTIWLNEHLFRAPNHWARGNHGSYWSYHLSRDQTVIDGSPSDHDLFSPVLLHELGHIVMYNLVNRTGPVVDTPACARNCGDLKTCGRIPQLEREANCISPYCMPFDAPAGTENWAEQYRFYYQSSITRSLLERANLDCRQVLAALETDAQEPHWAPWEQGLPDIPDFRRSLWESCGGQACKAW